MADSPLAPKLVDDQYQLPAAGLKQGQFLVRSRAAGADTSTGLVHGEHFTATEAHTTLVLPSGDAKYAYEGITGLRFVDVSAFSKQQVLRAMEAPGPNRTVYTYLEVPAGFPNLDMDDFDKVCKCCGLPVDLLTCLPLMFTDVL